VRVRQCRASSTAVQQSPAAHFRARTHAVTWERQNEHLKKTKGRGRRKTGRNCENMHLESRQRRGERREWLPRRATSFRRRAASSSCQRPRPGEVSTERCRVPLYRIEIETKNEHTKNKDRNARVFLTLEDGSQQRARSRRAHQHVIARGGRRSQGRSHRIAQLAATRYTFLKLNRKSSNNTRFFYLSTTGGCRCSASTSL
jgi:hypothetical protein